MVSSDDSKIEKKYIVWRCSDNYCLDFHIRTTKKTYKDGLQSPCPSCERRKQNTAGTRTRLNEGNSSIYDTREEAQKALEWAVINGGLF